MILGFRRNLFALFAVFFVVMTPFLVIYSLGFELNLEQNRLSNTLSITIETLPRGASIYNKTNKIGSSPTELKAKDGQLVPLTLKSDGYLDEDFVLRGQDRQNTTARITNLSLIPKNGDVIANFDEKPLAILTNDLLLLLEGDKAFVQSYGFAGFQGTKFEVKKDSQREVKQDSWEVLSNFSFWSQTQDFLLSKVDDVWQMIDLQNFPQKFVNIINIDQNNFLLQDSMGQLWTMSNVNKELSFLDSGVTGLSSTITPDNVWIWKQDKIYRLKRVVFTLENFNLETSLFSNLPFVFNEDTIVSKFKNFQAASVFQGILFKIGQSIFYVPDSNKNVWQSLSVNVSSFTVDSNTVFWVDDQRNIFTYNFLFKQETYIGTVDTTSLDEDIRLSYYYPWRRLFIYTADQVFTVWFDKDIENDTVVQYFPQQWIDNVACFPQLIDKFQYCVQDKKLMSWKNTSIW